MGMTATELQNAVRVLANGAWCRYWLSWAQYTTPDTEVGTLMAVQCRDETGKPQPICDAMRHGFSEHENFIYTIPRTTEDGKTYKSV